MLAGVFAAWNGLRAKSRLLRPEALLLANDRPDHLFGRAEDVSRLARQCRDNKMVFLTGESGAGKTALLRAGLVPAVQKELLPIYMGTWGDEWEQGPQRSLREAFQQSLTRHEVTRLAFGTHLDDEALWTVLRECSGKLGRRPLIVLDQFDDYQNRHRDRFLEDQAWIDADTLASRNAFWARLRTLVDGEEVRVLVATRSDVADGLASIRLVAKPLPVPLHRLKESVVEPLLIHLTEPDKDSPPIVSNPERGWVQLRARLAAELGTGGTVLGAQLRVVFASLEYLNPLSVTALDAMEGVPGLEAAYIRGHIAETARSSALSESQVRALLVGLVERESGTKTVPRSMGELQNIVSSPAAATPDAMKKLVAALADLTAGGIVRELPATSRGEMNYVLTHDYLCAGVLEAERQANRWTEILKTQQRLFDSAVGAPLRQWKTLLSPILQLKLAFSRMRGRFRYGPYRTYAGLSLARFLPAIIVVGIAVVAAVKVTEFQKNLQSQFDEVEVRDRVNRIFDPLGLGAASDSLSEREVSALWTLAGTDETTRRAFVRKIFESPDNAKRFVRRSPYVLHALWGLNRGLAERLCAPCAPEWNYGDANNLYAEALIGTALPSLNTQLLDSVLTNSTGGVGSAPDGFDVTALSEQVAAFARRATPEFASKAFDRLYTHVTTESYGEPSEQVTGAALSALAERLGDTDVGPRYQASLSFLRTETGVRRIDVLMRTFAVLAGRSGSSEAAAAVAMALNPEALKSVSYGPEAKVGRFYRDIIPAAERLPAAEARQRLESLIFSRSSHLGANGVFIDQGLRVALVRQLDPSAADGVFRRSWTERTTPNSGLDANLLLLATRLSPGAASEYLGRILTPGGPASAPRLDFRFLSKLEVALARRLEPSDAAALFARWRTARGATEYVSDEERQLSTALARRIDRKDYGRLFPTAAARNAVADKAGCDPASAVLAALDALITRVEYQGSPTLMIRDKPQLRQAYGVMLAGIAGSIPVESVAPCFTMFLAALKRPDSWGDQRLPPALAIAALAPRLDAHAAVEAFAMLSPMLKTVRDADALSDLGAGVHALALRLDPGPAKQAFASFYTAIVSPPEEEQTAYDYRSQPLDASTIRESRQAAYTSALLGAVRPGDETLLVDLLKRPDEIMKTKHALLMALASLLNAPAFNDDLWAAAAAAQQRHLPVESIPDQRVALPK